MRRAIAVLIAGCVSLGPAITTQANAAPSVASTVMAKGRVRINFNAGWSFKLADVAGAQDPAFDDSAWEPIGLPHSFSIPYFRSPAFYVGYGWYRKTFTLPKLATSRRVSLEFEGAFQEAEVFVNGASVAHHRGGYTGFPVDITTALRPGKNVVAVRVNNKWDPTLAPRAGEHVFSGGIYRDVWLVATDAVHVPWTGTFITTPDLSDASGRVAAQTEVRNDGGRTASVSVQTKIVDAAGKVVAKLDDQSVSVPAGQTIIVKQQSEPIAAPRLWSPETPVLYHAISSLSVAGQVRDQYDTEFGFRWIQWTADKGFFLNGKHRYFRGADVHQDQAGWGDAVTNAAIDRDVKLVKDAGFDFIRGSHYPHDPHFAEATDRIGVLFLSEESFWGTAGFKSDWAASAYPTDPSQNAAFDDSVKQQLAEMIRINRNHPSIIVWGMDNEVYFTANGTLPQVKRLLAEEVALTHQLDPTRPAAVDGAQRGSIDKIGDVAGYNGDGATLFPNPGIPNFVAEYGSTTGKRPGKYEAGFGDLPRTPGAGTPTAENPYPWQHLAWRSGEAIWSAFDHGSIAGRNFGSTGFVDYARLPKRQWYWYRNAYLGIKPPVWPQPGTPAALRLTSSSPTIKHADGTDDVQLIVTVLDAQGNPISNSPPVTLAIESGPGELPTGRTIHFASDSDIAILDGEAAIAMRSWQAGTTRLRASSPGLKDAVLQIKTLDGPPFIAGVTPLAKDRLYVANDPDVLISQEEKFGTDNPTDSSSSAADHPSNLVNDGNMSTYWAPAAGDSEPRISVDPERILLYRRVRIVFPQAAGYGFVAELLQSDGTWKELAKQDVGSDTRRVRDIVTQQLIGERMRVRVLTPGGATAGVSEIVISGILQNK